MNVYEALYTTRAMRRVKPDPIPVEIQARILDAAIRAPSGGNTQDWRFLVVDDPQIRANLGPVYRECMDQLWSTVYAARIAAAQADPETPQSRETMRMVRSAQHLADHFESTPLLLFAFSQRDSSGSSIFPAVWSAQLAARAEGIGSCLTTILGFREQETYEILGVPSGTNWRMACCVTMGYPTGEWGVAKRRPLSEVTYRNQWGESLPGVNDQPLWNGASDA